MGPTFVHSPLIGLAGLQQARIEGLAGRGRVHQRQIARRAEPHLPARGEAGLDPAQDRVEGDIGRLVRRAQQHGRRTVGDGGHVIPGVVKAHRRVVFVLGEDAAEALREDLVALVGVFPGVVGIGVDHRGLRHQRTALVLIEASCHVHRTRADDIQLRVEAVALITSGTTAPKS